MRQADEAELIINVRFQLAQLGQRARTDLAGRHYEARKRAEQIVAEHIVRGALGRYEVLSNSPVPEGSDLFTAGAQRSGRGSAPKIVPEDD